MSDTGAVRAMLAIVAAATLLRLAVLATSGLELYPDEAQYWSWSRDLAAGYYSKPPLIGWLIRLETGLCGHGEACIRAASPILHGATALLVFGLARNLADARAGLWAGLLYLTLPGISYSALLISTDVPLLFFWTAALFALERLLATGRAGWVWPLGLAIGLGLMSKYAMAYFALGLALLLLVRRDARAVLTPARLALTAALALLVLAPNLMWNWQSGFATVQHTADNANWGGDLFRPLKALEFAAGQFALMGPLPLIAWLVATGSALRTGAGPDIRLLLAFSAPVLLLVLIQAGLSRAHANWAATAYPAATVLAALHLAAWRPRWRVWSAALHAGVAAVLYLAVVLLPWLKLPARETPVDELLGWQDLADAVDAAADTAGVATVYGHERSLVASLDRALHRHGRRMAGWLDPDDGPRHHYALARPHRAGDGPALLVSAQPEPGPILRQFRRVRDLGTLTVAVRPGLERSVHLYLTGPGDGG